MLWLLALGLQVDEDAEKFKKVFNKSAEQVLEIVGEPAGRYVDEQGVTAWLFEAVVAEKDGKRFCPELLFRMGKSFQLNRIPEETMKRAVVAAASFKDWSPPAEVKEKEFFLADTRIAGMSKTEVAGKLGEPDGKKIFNGIESWFYKKVRISEADPKHLTIYVEFDGDKASGSKGN